MAGRDSLLCPTRAETVSDLLGAVWQLGYVTSDLEWAGRVLADRLGLGDLIDLPSREASYLAGEEPIHPWEARYAIAARGDLIIELIEPISGPAELYATAVPGDGSFAVRLHHLAVAVPTGEGEWERLRRLVEAAGMAFDFSVDFPDRIRAAYVDSTAELGHMIEICQLAEETAAYYVGLLDA